MHVRTPPPPFPYLRNGWTDCAETWRVIRGLLAIHFEQDGGYLLDRMCKCTHIYADLSAAARSSPKRRLTGYSWHAIVRDIWPVLEHVKFLELSPLTPVTL